MSLTKFVYTQKMRDNCAGENINGISGHYFTRVGCHYEVDDDGWFEGDNGRRYRLSQGEVEDIQRLAASEGEGALRIPEPGAPCLNSKDGRVKMESKSEPPEGALKFDGDKVRLALVPGKVINAIAQALEHGEKEYGVDNLQREAPSKERMFSAAMGHLLADLDGEELDQKSGLPHVYHAIGGLAVYLARYVQEPVRERFSAPGS